MYKKIFLVLVVLCTVILVSVAPAQAIYLDSSWYAQLTNVRVEEGSYPMDWLPGAHSSAHMNVTGSGISSGNRMLWTGTFSIPQPMQVPENETASWGNMFLDPQHTFGAISFDYQTYWTQPNLRLELWAYYLMPWDGQSAVVWSSSGTSLRSGHVTINNNPNGYYFKLVAVPEPAGLLSLSMLCGTGGLLGLRLRALRRRTE